VIKDNYLNINMILECCSILYGGSDKKEESEVGCSRLDQQKRTHLTEGTPDLSRTSERASLPPFSVNPQEKQADVGLLADQLSISVLLCIAGST
jgi:hypothetical protein